VRALGGLGPFEWCEDDDLDLEYHVRHSALPHPGRIRELLALVSRLHGTLLDRNRPLWETHVIEGLEGRPDRDLQQGPPRADRRGLGDALDGGRAQRGPRRARHAPAVGVASAASAEGALGWTARRRARGRPRIARGRSAVGQASVAAVRTAVRALEDRAQALPYQAPRTILNQPITGARRFAAESWPMERIRTVGEATDGSVNDVVLAMCAGALRRYLLDQDALPDQPLVAAVPVSLKKDDDGPSEGNAVGAVLCNLGTHLEDPAERYEMIHRSMRDAKSQMQGMGQLGVTLLSAVNFGPVALGPLFRYRPLRKPPFNLIISNVPGPAKPLYWNGSRLEGIYPASIPFDGQALNITVTSYAGSLEFGIVGCRRRVPHLQRLLDHLETSLAELEALAG
jgi:diacylglycerol O-acyltransferase / wax synthase